MAAESSSISIFGTNLSTAHLQETLPDEGYVDMYQVMKALREVRYAGPMVPDHVPAMAGDQGMNRGGTSYCISYMRALLRRANEEVG